MVDASVTSLVGTDVEDKVFHRSLVFGHIPILDRDVRNGELRVRPFRQMSFINLLDGHRVCMDSLLFKVAH